MHLDYTLKSTDSYKTINDVLINEFKLSTRLISKLIKSKKIHLNKNLVDTRSSLNTNDIVTVYLDHEEDNSNIVPTPMDLDIVYEDEWFLVINKPSGIAIHPSCMHYSTSLSNGVRYHFDKLRIKKENKTC